MNRWWKSLPAPASTGSKIVPYVDHIATARVRAEQQLDQVTFLEAACYLIPLGQRLRRHKKLLDRHDLYIVFENDPNRRHPGLYLIKKDHSRWARVWVCGGGFRLDADERSSSYSDVYSMPWYEIMRRDLSIDIDVAEQAIVTILERDELRLGNGYLPNDLTTDLDSALPDFTPPRPKALPAPTIELKAIEVKPVTPAALRPVALARKPLPPR